jgi:hypothetical protein
MEFKAFNDFQYHGVYVSAYIDNEGQTKKETYHPIGYTEQKSKHSLKDVWDKKNGCLVKTNGIAIHTKGLTTIDVDIPDQCSILEELKNDCGFWVKTRKGFHFYFKETAGINQGKDKQFGIADINTDLLYYIPTYTNIDNGETYHYELEKNTGLVELPKYAIDWCNMLIAMKPKTSSSKKVKRDTKEKIIKQPDILIEKFNLKVMNCIFEILERNGFFNKYEGWRDVCYMARHLNNTEECFKLFETFSRRGYNELKSYKNVPELELRKAYFGNGEYNINFNENGVLFKCMRLNPEKYKKTLDHLYKSKYDDCYIKINSQYLKPEDKSLDYIYNDWIDNYKFLCIKSAYGTGKTFTFKSLLREYPQFKKVLFLTYRQSLAYSLEIELANEYDFKSYINKDTNCRTADRLICQLDSIGKTCNYDIMIQSLNVNHYDLIVLDEIEGLLNHISYDRIDQNHIHNILCKTLNKATKVLCLDGDLSDRSLDFVSGLSDSDSYKIYQNDYKPNQKKFVFTHDGEEFMKQIRTDLTNGKKVCIVSLTKGEEFKEIFEKDFKVIIHNSLERNKEILKNVKTEWINAELLIYSPSVEAGVDFDVKNHFHKCYSNITNTSTSYRAFSQMLNRIRNFIDNEVLCLLPVMMPYKLNQLLYRYDEIKLTKYSGIEETHLTQILIHNETEKINSNNMFLTAFVKMIVSKGHSYEYRCYKKRSKATEGQTQVYKEAIVNAKNITDIEYENIVMKEKQNIELTRDEIYSRLKMLYKLIFKLENVSDVNKEFIDLHYNKFKVMKNYKDLLREQHERNIADTEILKKVSYNKVDILLDLMKKMNINITNDNESECEFDKGIEIITNTLNDRKYQISFDCNREVKKLNILKCINESLENYGINITKEKYQVRNKETKKIDCSYTLKVNVLKIVKEFNEREENIKLMNEIENVVENDENNENNEVLIDC